jgi:NAD(P)H-dependent FMN reductase
VLEPFQRHRAGLAERCQEPPTTTTLRLLAIDYLYAEWNDKAAALVGYGFDGGARAIEHLRLILAEVKVADVRTPVTLRFGEDFAGYNELTPRDSQQQAVQAMLDDLLSWGQALAALRDQG